MLLLERTFNNPLKATVVLNHCLILIRDVELTCYTRVQYFSNIINLSIDNPFLYYHIVLRLIPHCRLCWFLVIIVNCHLSLLTVSAPSLQPVLVECVGSNPPCSGCFSFLCATKKEYCTLVRKCTFTIPSSGASFINLAYDKIWPKTCVHQSWH